MYFFVGLEKVNKWQSKNQVGLVALLIRLQ